MSPVLLRAGEGLANLTSFLLPFWGLAEESKGCSALSRCSQPDCCGFRREVLMRVVLNDSQCNMY